MHFKTPKEFSCQPDQGAPPVATEVIEPYRRVTRAAHPLSAPPSAAAPTGPIRLPTMLCVQVFTAMSEKGEWRVKLKEEAHSLKMYLSVLSDFAWASPPARMLTAAASM